MAKAIDWDSRIGRRIRLRDLHILFAVVQHGSMAKAGAYLHMSQSAVSQAIAAIEHTLGVRLLAGQNATDLDAQFKDIGAKSLGALDLAGLVGIIEDQRMKVAVAGVEDICYREPVPVRQRADPG